MVKQAICSIPWPNSKKEVYEFLGLPDSTGSGYLVRPSEIAKPLFKATAGSGKEPLSGDMNRKRPSRR